MNVIEHNSNIANDDGVNNERKSYIVSDIYMILNTIRCIESTICEKKFKI